MRVALDPAMLATIPVSDLFAVARVAGWAAHYMEELTERPLRFRARAVYSV